MWLPRSQIPRLQMSNLTRCVILDREDKVNRHMAVFSIEKDRDCEGWLF